MQWCRKHGNHGALDPIDKILWGYGPMEFYIIDNYGLRLTAQYIIRCTLMVCGLRSSCTSHIYKNYKLFWMCPHDQNHLPMPMVCIRQTRPRNIIGPLRRLGLPLSALLCWLYMLLAPNLDVNKIIIIMFTTKRVYIYIYIYSIMK